MSVATGAGTYPAILRILHWSMAIGFAFVWISGVLTINLEGLGSASGDALQTTVRNLHKSVALTLMLLLAVRLAARLLLGTPPLPAHIPPRERHAAHLGHAAIYVLVVLIGLTGLAIADLQGFGNAYFGIKLPALYPVMAKVAGWSVDPWSYVVHATLAYLFLLLIGVHVGAVYLHRKQGIGLESRITGQTPRPRWWVDLAAALLIVTATNVLLGALRGHLTLSPAEIPRDYSMARMG